MKCIALFVILLCFLFFNLHSQIIHIPADYPTIQQGIDIAEEGDTVLVSPGIYLENLYFDTINLTLASHFLITNDTSFISSTIIDGHDESSVFRIQLGQDTTTLICGFTVKNGHGILYKGGGFHISNSSVILEHLHIINNQSEEGGGIYLAWSSSVIRNCVIEQNQAVKGGGILASYYYPKMSNLTINQNFASSEGGGIKILSCEPVIENILIENNTSGSAGGGVVIVYSNKKILFSGVNILSNSAPDGAGIYNNAKVYLQNCIISGNIAGDYGGGIYSRDSLWVQHSEVNNNVALSGGGFYINSSFLSTDSVNIEHNQALYGGGGIYCRENSVIRLNQTSINANSGGGGGGIYSYLKNDVTLSGTNIKYNQSSQGGGLYLHYGKSVKFDTVNRSSIYLNSSENYGNDLYSMYDTVNIIVDTFTVKYPTEYHAEGIGNFNFDILSGKILQTDADLYVSPSGNDTNTGLTPDDPLRTIRSAYSRLRADSSHINAVHLANGLYSPSTGYQFPLNLINFSNLSGESMENTILNAEGASSVIILRNDTVSLIEKLTIKGGGNIYDGGGIYSRDSEFHGRDLLITENTSTYDGGGISIFNNEKCSRENSFIINNNSVNGGGIYCRESGITLQSVTFLNDTAYMGGGIVLVDISLAKFTDLKFSNNEGYSKGGGIYASFTSDFTISSSVFESNTSAEGGGIYSRFSSPSISNCLFTSNVGIHTCSGIETNGNLPSDSSKIYSRITNTTFADNSTPAVLSFDASISLVNNIFWGNAGPFQMQILDADTFADTLILSHSNIQDGINGIGISGVATVIWLDGNLDSDPLFMEAGNDPFALDAGSPCIDAGTTDTTGLFLPYNDIIGNTRVWDGDGNGTYIIDMGAYEFGAPVSLPEPGKQVINTSLETSIYPNPSGEQITITWLNSHGRMYISLLNSEGLHLQSFIIPPGPDKFVIDLKPFPQGIYFILLKDESGAGSSEKLVLIK